MKTGSSSDSDADESPRKGANWFSKLFFCWVIPIIRLGRRKELEVGDICKTLPEDSAYALGTDLSLAWEYERANKSRPSLFRALGSVFYFQFIELLFICLLNNSVFKFGQSICIYALLQYSELNGLRGDWAIALTVVLLFVSFSFTVLVHFNAFNSARLGLRMRIALSKAVYKKMLLLSTNALATTNIGQITNFISNDVNRFDRYMFYLPYLIVGPVHLVVVAIFLYFCIGVPCFAGIGVLVLFAPFQGAMGRAFGYFRRKVAKCTDYRIRLTSEVVNGIFLIKTFTWEEPFTAIITEARKNEMTQLRRKGALDAFNKGISDVSSKIAVLVTLIALVLTGNQLTASSVFLTLSMYETLKPPLCSYFPMAVMGLYEIIVSTQRIQKFLLVEERERKEPGSSKPSEKWIVRMRKYTASWTKGQEPALTNITLRAQKGDLLAVVGSVGSGKTSLLYGLLNELTLVRGETETTGRIAYASQEPIFYPGSIQANILFGRPMRTAWYAQVLIACSLDRDLRNFPYGDQTIVGDHGITLSGGQKTRISLARAVYADADIVLLDDPLSAVDARVAAHIFQHVIMELLADKCVVLVTHQLHFLVQASEIVVLEDGQVLTRGTYQQLNGSKHLAGLEERMAKSPARRRSSIPDPGAVSIDDVHDDDQVPEPHMGSTEIKRAGSTKSYGTFGTPQPEDRELRSEGAINSRVYMKYFLAGSSIPFLILFVAILISGQWLLSGSDYWLRLWTDSAAREEGERERKYLWTYCGIIGLTLLASITKFQLIYWTCLDSAKALHRRLFSSIIRAPMRFFKINSFGRVLNRFVNDVGAMDETFPALLLTVQGTALAVLGAMVNVALTNPIMALPALVLLVLFYFFRRFYLKASSNLKRLETVLRSPVFGHMSSSLNGLINIRAFGMQTKFTDEFDSVQDSHTSAYYLSLGVTRWLAVVVDWCVNAYFAATIFGFFFIQADSAMVGLALTSAIGLTAQFAFGTSQLSEMENQLISVERILEYSKVEPEGDSFIPGKKPPSSWPSKGKVQYHNVVICYGDDPPVLQDVTFVINPGEKIGIVGRTGTGKTSLVGALFRIVEPTSGSIHIDGVDISQVGLRHLRSRLGLIPQDPLLLIGTIRRNLDPVKEFTDADLMQAVSDVGLTERLGELGLESKVSEGGSNLSQGERQLLCLARASLHKCKILILDEATASVDAETDALIQRIVREKFAGSTVITVAHRLDTVMRSDRICLLDKCRIIEFDEPHVLLEQEQGHLRSLIRRTGPGGEAYLRRIARVAYERRHGPSN